jgi:hypothetical protein
MERGGKTNTNLGVIQLVEIKERDEEAMPCANSSKKDRGAVAPLLKVTDIAAVE